jgi:hypothetical protein
MGRSPVRVAVVRRGVAPPVDVRDAGEIERALAAFARPKNGGLIAMGSAATIVHRDRVISLAARPTARRLLRSLFCRCRRLDFTIPIVLRSVVSPPATSIESLGARSRPTCRCRRAVSNISYSKMLGCSHEFSKRSPRILRYRLGRPTPSSARSIRRRPGPMGSRTWRPRSNIGAQRSNTACPI